MRVLPLISVSLFTLLLSACNAEHPAEGSWHGTLITGGKHLDMGKVIIGSNYIEIPEIDQRYNGLSFTTSSKETFFTRKTGNVQGTDANMLAGTSGSIRFMDEKSAQMTINEIQGTITLTR